jgi:hypothetical protein
MYFPLTINTLKQNRKQILHRDTDGLQNENSSIFLSSRHYVSDFNFPVAMALEAGFKLCGNRIYIVNIATLQQL